MIIFSVNKMFLNEYPKWVSGIASFDINHLLKNNINRNHIKENKVVARDINSILSEIDFKNNIDLLQIDTEGYDFEILKMFNFLEIKPKIIRYEHVNLSRADIQAAISNLRSFGYHCFSRGSDSFAIDVNKIKLYL